MTKKNENFLKSCFSFVSEGFKELFKFLKSINYSKYLGPLKNLMAEGLNKSKKPAAKGPKVKTKKAVFSLRFIINTGVAAVIVVIGILVISSLKQKIAEPLIVKDPKKLIFMRHGTAMPATGNPEEDFYRLLSTEGLQEVSTAAAEMRGELYMVDKIFTSPATRAFDTAAILAYDFNADIITLAELADPNASIEMLEQTILGHSDNNSGTIVIVGHNPTVSTLASNISKHKYNLNPGQYAIIDME